MELEKLNGTEATKLGTKLAPRLWSLYNYLKAKSPDTWVSQEEIAANVTRKTRNANGEVIEEEPYYELHESTSTTNKCPMLFIDIEELNRSEEIQKIIVTKKYKYKLATKDEAAEYINYLQIKAKRMFKRAYSIQKKYSANGQGYFIDGRGNLVDETSFSRGFYESFVDLEVEEDEKQ